MGHDEVFQQKLNFSLCLKFVASISYTRYYINRWARSDGKGLPIEIGKININELRSCYSILFTIDRNYRNDTIESGDELVICSVYY